MNPGRASGVALRYGPLVLVMVGAAALRFWALGQSPLYQDEAYYWLWSKRLAPAYYDHPAGVALLMRASTTLGGQAEAGIRWLNALLGVVAVAAVYLLTRHVGSRTAATVAAVWVATAPPYLLTSRFVYTDALQHALLPLALLPIAKLLANPDTDPTWGQTLAAGLLWAALLNTKYSAYVAAGLALGGVVWLRPKLLRNARLWAGVGLAAMGLLPALLWNAAHDWASFRWQAQHFLAGGLLTGTPGSSLKNLVDYVGAPLLVFAALGLAVPPSRFGRLLWVSGIGLSAPVALSPANSPRNLSSGLLLLIALAAASVERWGLKVGQRQRWVWLGVAGLLSLNAAWGLGSVVESLRPTWLPHNRAATLMRRDAAGWRDAGGLEFEPGATIYCIDYSIAGQLSYYTGRPTYSSWGQFRIWGAPSFDDVCVVALPFVDGELVGARLREDFESVSGPEERLLGAGGDVKTLRVWRASRPRLGADRIVAHLDLAGLLPGR